MNEFKEKLDEFKDSMTNVISDEDQITINIPGEESDYQEDASEQPSNSNQRNEKGHRKRPGKGLKSRLNSLVYENKTKEMQNQQLLALVQEQERKLAEANAKAEQNAHYTNVYYEQSLDNEKQGILSELRAAEEEGDIDKKIKLQDRLADINAQKQTQLLSKTLQRQQEAQNSNNYNNYYQPPTYNPPPPPPIEDENEDLEEFLDRNPFLNPNLREYDPAMGNEVSEFALHLNKVLKVNGHSDLIGTREYYNIIDEEINKRYRIDNTVNSNQEQYEDNMNYTNRNNYEVAPVSRKGSSMADRYVSSPQNYNNRNNPLKVSLSPQEIAVAERMASTLAHVNGKQYTREEAIAEYAKYKALGPNVKEV